MSVDTLGLSNYRHNPYFPQFSKRIVRDQDVSQTIFRYRLFEVPVATLPQAMASTREWLDEIKEGWAARFAGAFEELGACLDNSLTCSCATADTL
jgi:hypothetical protein